MAIDREVQKVLDQISDDLKILEGIKERQSKLEKEITELKYKLKMVDEPKFGLNESGIG